MIASRSSLSSASTGTLSDSSELTALARNTTFSLGLFTFAGGSSTYAGVSSTVEGDSSPTVSLSELASLARNTTFPSDSFPGASLAGGALQRRGRSASNSIRSFILKTSLNGRPPHRAVRLQDAFAHRARQGRQDVRRRTRGLSVERCSQPGDRRFRLPMRALRPESESQCRYDQRDRDRQHGARER